MRGILVVDDQEQVRTYIGDMIREMDMEIGCIFEASDGMEALELVVKNKPEIILADIMMPGLNGLEFISKVREKKIECHIIIISAHQDFQYAKKAINYKVDDYILKPVHKKELYSVLLNALSSVQRQKYAADTAREQENRYRDILLFEYLTGKDVFINGEKLLESLEKAQEHTYFKIAAMQLKIEERNGEELSGIITNTGHKMELAGYVVIHCLHVADKLIFILGSGEEQKYRKEMGDFLPEHKEKNICWGCSDTLPGIRSMRELYRQAGIALKESVHRGREVMSYSDIKRNPGMIIGSSKCGEVLGLMENGMKNELDRFLGDLFIQLNMDHYCITEIESSMFYLVEYLYLHLVEEYQGICDIDVVRKRLFESKKIFNIKITVKQIIDGMYDFIHRYRVRENSNQAVDYMLKFIKANFHKDISLAQAANELSMNYSYISNLFTLKVGHTFSDYLMLYRLEKSKKLLVDSTDKIHEIANKCGYNNTKYFFKVFKEQLGLTPGEYRRLYSKHKCGKMVI